MEADLQVQRVVGVEVGGECSVGDDCVLDFGCVLGCEDQLDVVFVGVVGFVYEYVVGVGDC